MVILNKFDILSNKFFEFFMIITFEEKTTFIAEYFGFDDLNVGDLSIDNIHGSVLSVESSEMSIQLLILRMRAVTGNVLGC